MTHGRGHWSLRGGAFAALVTLFAAFHASAQTPCRAAASELAGRMTIAWAEGADGNQDATRPANNVRFAPDGKTTDASGSNWLLADSFKRKATYDTLAAKLCLSARDLKAYDIIAFEGNSQKQQFENSIWFLTDNNVWAAGTFTGSPELPGPVFPTQLNFRAGWMPVSDYRHFFGEKIEIRNAENKLIDNVGWILIDLPDTVKMDPASVKLFLNGLHKPKGSKFEGSPEPDAIGMIVHN